jgi:hypothetical protein
MSVVIDPLLGYENGAEIGVTTRRGCCRVVDSWEVKRRRSSYRNFALVVIYDPA